MVAHGGLVWLASEGVGKGTTICFSIPLSADGARAVGDAVLGLGSMKERPAAPAQMPPRDSIDSVPPRRAAVPVAAGTREGQEKTDEARAPAPAAGAGAGAGAAAGAGAGAGAVTPVGALCGGSCEYSES